MTLDAIRLRYPNIIDFGIRVVRVYVARIEFYERNVRLGGIEILGADCWVTRSKLAIQTTSRKGREIVNPKLGCWRKNPRVIRPLFGVWTPELIAPPVRGYDPAWVPSRRELVIKRIIDAWGFVVAVEATEAGRTEEAIWFGLHEESAMKNNEKKQIRWRDGKHTADLKSDRN